MAFSLIVEAAAELVRVTVDASLEVGLIDRSIDWKFVITSVFSLSLEARVRDDSVVDFTGRRLESVGKKFSWCDEASLIIVVSST